MNGILEKLVKVDIDIKTAVPDSASFDNMLIVGAAPIAAPETAPADIKAYESMDAVTAAGWDINNDPIAKAAFVAFQNGAEKIYIAVRREVSAEVESETVLQPEEISVTLNRANSVDGWYAVASVGATEDDIILADQWVTLNEKLLCFAINEKKKLLSDDAMRSMGWYYENDEDYNPYINVAVLAACLQYTAGSETWAYKTLKYIDPITVTETQAAELDALGLNYYISCAGRKITQTGKVCGGEWIDTIRFRDWLHNDIQKRIYTLLCDSPKIPFTNSGIGLIENQITASLKAGQDNGGIAATEYDEDGNEVRGYSVTVPNAVNVSAEDKATRTLHGCKFTARLAGAIHIVEISGELIT